ncbi:ZN316 protein, partial [Crypturellus undulatus]|nr:ZN316 protein [Crypturellus undulatus]
HVWQEPVTFEDVAIYLSRAEWEVAAQWQRELYRGVMVANYELLTSLGYPGPKPDILYRLEHREEPWV